MRQTQIQKETNDPSAKRGGPLVELRKLFGLSQEQLALWLYEDEPEQPTQPQAAASQWETGRRPMPYERLAKKMGVSVDWLMGFSTEMWGQTVHSIRQAVRKHLISLPQAEQKRLQSPAVSPSERMKVVVSVMMAESSALITERYLTQLITRGDVCALREVLAGETYADDTMYRRMADWLAIPPEFFEYGDVSVLRESTREPFAAVIDMCVARGVSPDKLEQLVAVIAG